MRWLFFLFPTMMVAQMLNAQAIFCPEGARWVYYSPGGGQSFENQSHFIYAGDTIIDGADAKILKQEIRVNYPWEQSGYSEFRSYFNQRNDSIFQYVDGNFEFMFDFGVQTGDTRVVYIGGDLCAAYDTMLIETTGLMTYQGQQLRTYDYKILIEDQISQIEGPGNAGARQGQFIERLGFTVNHPVNNFFYCEGNLISEYAPINLVCYTDSELAVNYPDTCNLFLDATEREARDSELTIYQNKLIVKNAPNSTLFIYDTLGKQVFQERITSDNQSIDVSHLPNGILLVVVETESGRVTKKLVKTSY